MSSIRTIEIQPPGLTFEPSNNTSSDVTFTPRNSDVKKSCVLVAITTRHLIEVCLNRVGCKNSPQYLTWDTRTIWVLPWRRGGGFICLHGGSPDLLTTFCFLTITWTTKYIEFPYCFPVMAPVAVISVKCVLFIKHNVLLITIQFFFNLLKTKRNLLYIRNQSVPRSKHFPPRL